MATKLFQSWSWRFPPRGIHQKRKNRKKEKRKKRVTGKPIFLASIRPMKNLMKKSQEIPDNRGKIMWSKFACPRRFEQKRWKANSVVSWQSCRG